MEKGSSNRDDLATACYKNPQLPVEQRIDDLLARMTLHEKIRQTTMFPFFPVSWTTGAGPALCEPHVETPGGESENDQSVPSEHRSKQQSKGRLSIERLRDILGECAPGLIRELEYEPDSAAMCRTTTFPASNGNRW